MTAKEKKWVVFTYLKKKTKVNFLLVGIDCCVLAQMAFKHTLSFVLMQMCAR